MWVTATILLLSVSIGWYVTLPVAWALSTQVETVASGNGLSALRIVEYVVILWGPLWDLFIILWAFLESHRVDTMSVAYGG